MKKIIFLVVFTFTIGMSTCFATTGTDLIDQYLNTYGSTRVNFAEAGFKYYYEGYNGTTTWRVWLFSVNEPTIQSGKLYQLNGPFYVLNYTPNKGFYDNITYLNNSTNRTLSSVNTSAINGSSGGNSAFFSSYYPNVVNSNISAYDRPLQYYEDLLNPTWNGVFEDGTQKGVINFNEAGYYIYTNPLYPGIDYSRFRLVLNLVEFSASGVSQMTKESMSPSYADNIVKLQDNLTSSLESQQIISLESIRKYLKTSKIYRLEYSILAYDENNSLSTSAFCTSEFFSLNSWTSDKIIVRNISEFFNDSTGGIISPSGEISSGDYIINNTINNIGSDMNQNFNELNNTINDTILGTINESGEREGGLIGNLLDGLIGLFIPDSNFFFNDVSGEERGYFNQIQDFFSEHLGFLFFPFDFTIDIINRFSECLSNDMEAEWTIPDIYFPNFQNETDEPFFKGFTLNPKRDLIEKDEKIKDFYNTYLMLMDGLIVIAVIWLAEKKWNEVSKS